MLIQRYPTQLVDAGMTTVAITLSDDPSSLGHNSDQHHYSTSSKPAAVTSFEGIDAENASESYTQTSISEILLQGMENVTTAEVTSASFMGQMGITDLMQSGTSIGSSFTNTIPSTVATVDLNNSVGQGNLSVGTLVSFPATRLYGMCSYSFSISVIGVSLFLLIGTIGNTLSFVVMLRKRMRRKSICNYFAAMAFTEIVLLVVNSYVVLSHAASIGEQAVVLTVGCAPLRMLVNSTSTISSQLLTAASIERCIAVCYPIKSRTWQTVKKSRVVIFCIIVFNAVYSLPVFKFYLPVDIKFKGETYTLCENSDGKVYVTISVLLYSAAPLTIIIAANCQIIMKIYQGSKMMKNLCNYQTEIGIQWKIVLKTLPVLLALSFMFLITTVPSSVMFLLVFYNNNWAIIDSESSDFCSRMTLWSIIDLIRIGNYSLNFFIYCLTSENVRQELAVMFARTNHK